jgi:hypothetical protein
VPGGRGAEENGEPHLAIAEFRRGLEQVLDDPGQQSDLDRPFQVRTGTLSEDVNRYLISGIDYELQVLRIPREEQMEAGLRSALQRGPWNGEAIPRDTGVLLLRGQTWSLAADAEPRFTRVLTLVTLRPEP